MKRYTNISEQWGDAVEVTINDYIAQAAIYGGEYVIEERADGIYIDGEQVAETQQDGETMTRAL